MGCCCSRDEKKLSNEDKKVGGASEQQTSENSYTRSTAGLKSCPVKKKGETKTPRHYLALWEYHVGSGAELSLKTGDRLKEVEDAKGETGKDWVFVTRVNDDRCGTGYVPRAFVAAEGTLEVERWFFGKIPRHEAEAYLRGMPNGSFLVRVRMEDPTEKEFKARARIEYTVSFVQSGTCRHFHIWRLTDNYGGGYFMSKKKKFRTVVELIEWYRQAEGDRDLQTRLTEPPKKPTPTRIELSVELQKKWREIPRTQIQTVKEVGRGNFGVVYEGIWKATDTDAGQRVAVKELKRGSTQAKRVFLQEAVAMKNLTHKRLVKLYGVVSADEPYWIVTEFVKDGSLRQYLRQRFESMKPLSERQLVAICAQIADGMRYLEQESIVHRDLAARNVLVAADNEHIEVKIADFGLAQITSGSRQGRLRDRLPVKWSAPEALRDRTYSTASDVWSFGVVIHEVFTHGVDPYEVMQNTWVSEYVVKKKLILHKHDRVPERVYEMMKRCFTYEPAGRPSFDEIYKFFDHYYKTHDKDPSVSMASSYQMSDSANPTKSDTKKMNIKSGRLYP